METQCGIPRAPMTAEEFGAILSKTHDTATRERAKLLAQVEGQEHLMSTLQRLEENFHEFLAGQRDASQRLETIQVEIQPGPSDRSHAGQYNAASRLLNAIKGLARNWEENSRSDRQTDLNAVFECASGLSLARGQKEPPWSAPKLYP